MRVWAFSPVESTSLTRVDDSGWTYPRQPEDSPDETSWYAMVFGKEKSPTVGREEVGHTPRSINGICSRFSKRPSKAFKSWLLNLLLLCKDPWLFCHVLLVLEVPGVVWSSTSALWPKPSSHSSVFGWRNVPDLQGKVCGTFPAARATFPGFERPSLSESPSPFLCLATFSSLQCIPLV